MKIGVVISSGVALLPLAVVFAALTIQTNIVSDGDEWVEEVVIRRRRVVRKPAAAQEESPVAVEIKKKDLEPSSGTTAPQEVATAPEAVADVKKEDVKKEDVKKEDVKKEDVKKEEPPPPPEPTVADAAEPRRLVHYFCKCWKDENYERLWWAMTPQYRKATPLAKFSKLFKEDKENNGGVADESIVLDDVELDDGGIQVTVDLRYRFKRVGVKRVKAVVEKNGLVYRMRESGIIPLDLDDL